jgi:hypothetical protein
VRLFEFTEHVNVAPIIELLNSCRQQVCGQNLDNLEIEDVFNTAFHAQEINIRFYRFEGWGGSSLNDNWAKCFIIQGAINLSGRITIEYERDWYTFFADCDNEDWELFIRVISSIIKHELTHNNQIKQFYFGDNWQKGMKSMESDTDDTENYLGNPHEIAANAAEIVHSLTMISYSLDDILRNIRTTEGIKALAADCDSLFDYIKTFGIKDVVIKKLIQAIVRVIEAEKAQA